jgi:tetratricopeptide (TPR) repeat protein
MTDREPPELVQISPGEKRFVPTPPTPPEPPASPKSIPWKKIGEALAAVPKSIPLKEIGEGLAAVRSATLNGLMLASLVAIIYFAVAELRRDVVVIDPIRLPEALRQRGYSEDVAADRLWDEVGRINERTPTAKERVAMQPASQKLDFEPPGSGIALQEVVQMLRRFLGLKETRIVGEITCMTTECEPEGLALRLRVFHSDGMKSDPMKIIPVSLIGDQTNEAEIDQNPFGDGMKTIFLSPIRDQTSEAEIDRYFRAAAIELLRELDPYVVAFYLYQDDKPAAKHEALQLIAPTHRQRKWALNLLGFIAHYNRNYDRAIYWYRRAIAADEEENSAASWYQRAIAVFEEDEFAAIVYINWGNALGAKGERAEAKGKLAKAMGEPGEAEAEEELAKAKNALDEAIEKFKRAIKLDQKNVFAYNSWGNALGAKGDLDEAIEKFMRATELDSKYAVAYNNWGEALRAKNALDEAIEKFMRATELDPKYAVAHKNWGRALVAKGELAEAKGKLAKAEDKPGEAKKERANAKNALDEAIEIFTLATELDPKIADEIFYIAIALKKRSDDVESADLSQCYARDAADAFQRYLDLLPEPELDSMFAKGARKRMNKLRDKVEKHCTAAPNN